MTVSVLPAAKRVVGVVQPTYLPWLPFFERMARADVFVYLDDVQYSKNSFHNRNSIKGHDGVVLLTVPVITSGRFGALINEVQIDNRYSWGRKHWETIRQQYGRAPYFPQYADELQALLQTRSESLIGIVMPLIAFLRGELGVSTPCFLSSEFTVNGCRNEKLVALCKALGGTHFIVKPGTEDYHPAREFESHGISLHEMPYTSVRYPQLHGEFRPGLSALDFLLNCGPGRFLNALAAGAVPDAQIMSTDR